MILFDDFKKLDIRIGKILSAEKIEESEKLLKLEVDLGEEENRQIIAGISKYVEPGDIVGMQIPILANLASRQIMGYESQGMILAVSDESGLSLMHPAREVSPGSSVG